MLSIDGQEGFALANDDLVQGESGRSDPALD